MYRGVYGLKGMRVIDQMEKSMGNEMVTWFVYGFTGVVM